MSELDAIGKAFGEAVDLQGPARTEYLCTLRQSDPAAADEVESLLGYHDDRPPEGDEGKSGTGAGEGTAGIGGSLLDRPVAALLGMSAESTHGGVEDEPSLPPGTLLSADGLGEPGEGSTWSFKIIGELGRGGMGVVYEAEQSFPSRRVALKLLRGGVARGGTTVPTHGAGREAVGGIAGNAARRLMLEAEALGALHHPGIAHVHAAGTLRLVVDPNLPPSPAAEPPTAERWLFISMELVEGPTLGVWGRDRSLREKIAMIAEVCDAVEHAHQRGVVHRDLKPGNVLVEMGGKSAAEGMPAMSPPVVGQPKVLDFGVARLTNRTKRHDATLSIGRGQLIGTLRYMSPEQARGGSGGGVGGEKGVVGSAQSVDSRSDVYALGAILYELVTGKLPIPVDDLSIVGAIDRIVSATPARPQGLAAKLGRRRAADLETVLFKALAKEPGDRYQHASDLGADLNRVLLDEPISARPPTAREQLMRIVRRNRVATTGVAAGLALLIAGSGIATWQAIRATRALSKAKEEAAVSQSALYFMARMINAGTPSQMRGQDMTVREMLKTAVREVRSMPDDRATASACRMLAIALQDVGDPAEAEPLARRALAIDREMLGENDRETIESGVVTAHVTAQRGRQSEAITEARAWRERSLRAFGPDDPLSFRSTMALEFALDAENPTQLAEAEALLRDMIARMERLLPSTDHAVYSAKSDLCALLLNSDRASEALPLAQEIYNARVSTVGPDDPDTILSLGNYAAALADLGQLDRALELSAKNVDIAARVLGPEHPSTLFCRVNRVRLLLRKQQFKEAEPEAKTISEAVDRRLGTDTRLAINSRGVYISTILYQSRFDEADPMIRELITRAERVLGHDDLDTVRTITLLYNLAEARGDKAELAAVTKRLKGTAFDPETTPQDPPIGGKPKEPSPPGENK